MYNFVTQSKYKETSALLEQFYRSQGHLHGQNMRTRIALWHATKEADEKVEETMSVID